MKLLTSTLLIATLIGPISAQAAGPPIGIIVALRDGSAVSADYGITPRYTYRYAIRGFAASVSPATAAALARDPRVQRVELDGPVHIFQESAASWGLDRVDQRDLPLDGTYTRELTGMGVTAYIVDTGIRRTHIEFENRARDGTDTVNPGTPADDCNGHGTHVAGTVGGKTYGVANQVTLVAVRVLDCSGSGTWSQVIAGIDWVTGDHDPGEAAVANMSLGGAYNATVNAAVTASITDGVVYAIAAGNSNADACNYSPASTLSALTVGATDNTDTRATFSNWGTCLDLFGPGVAITSAYNWSDTDTATLSGTSMAAPHVAGTSALILQANPALDPAGVGTKLLGSATPDHVLDPAGSPNLTDYSLGYGAPPPPEVIMLTPTKMRLKGWHVIDLNWTPIDNPDIYVEVLRDGKLLAAIFDDGNYIDVPGTKGRGSYTYQVCLLYDGGCSNRVTVIYGSKEPWAPCSTAPHGCYRARPIAVA